MSDEARHVLRLRASSRPTRLGLNSESEHFHARALVDTAPNTRRCPGNPAVEPPLTVAAAVGRRAKCIAYTAVFVYRVHPRAAPLREWRWR